jgi:hypothetical protein
MLRLCIVALLAAAASASNAEGLAFLEAKKAESGVVRLLELAALTRRGQTETLCHHKITELKFIEEK